MRAVYRVAALSFILVMVIFTITVTQGQVVGAQDSGDGAGSGCGSTSFLGFPAWYNGLTTGDGCSEIMSPTEAGGVGPFIWIIVLNIVEIILRLAGWASVAFIIYGGYKYMISAGSPDGMVAARKTIMNAAIGLVISIAAVVIVSAVATGIGG